MSLTIREKREIWAHLMERGLYPSSVTKRDIWSAISVTDDAVDELVVILRRKLARGFSTKATSAHVEHLIHMVAGKRQGQENV